jgi:NTE family protein
MARANAAAKRRTVALALAGGGAHSAFTWGVLDFLLGDLRDVIEVAALCGTSGGAMNAAVAAYGLGDSEATAAKLLERFWIRTSEMAALLGNPYQHVANPLWPSWNIDRAPVATLLGMGAGSLAPAQLTPFHRNPLAAVLGSVIDTRRFKDGASFPDLYVCATNVRTSQLRVFERREVTTDALLASACLPSADWPVVIGDEAYWDGGFRADPAISPLLESAGVGDEETVDVILVGINPLMRDEVPLFAWQIADRVNEISFNSSLIDEVKRLMMMNDVLAQVDGLPAAARDKVKALPSLAGKRLVRLHFIEDEAFMAPLGVASKNNTALPFLELLRKYGCEAARRWWSEQGGREDFADSVSQRWRSRIEERFIVPHHWDAQAARARRPDAALASVAALAATTAS